MPVPAGAEKTISSNRWSSPGRVAWLGDGSGLVLDAADQSSSLLPQLWFVAYPSGEARRITNDLNRYFGVSLTADSSALVTVQTEVSLVHLDRPAGCRRDRSTAHVRERDQRRSSRHRVPAERWRSVHFKRKRPSRYLEPGRRWQQPSAIDRERGQ